MLRISGALYRNPRALRTVAVLSLTQVIAWGTLYYSFAMLWRELSAGSGWPLPALLLGFCGSLFLSGTASPAVGRSISRFGGRTVLTAGSLQAGLSLALLSTGQSIAMVAGWLLLGVSMAMTLYEAAFAVLALEFGEFHGEAATLVTLAGGFAGTVFYPLSGWLADTAGWQQCLLIYALLHGLIAAPLHWRHFAALPGPAVDKRIASPANFSTAVTQAPVRWLTMAFSLNAAVFAVMGILLELLLEDAGASRSEAAWAAALIGPAQVAGRIATLRPGRLGTHLRTAQWTFLLLPLALLGIMASFRFPAALLISLAIYGVCNGVSTLVRPAVIREQFGVAAFASVQGQLLGPAVAARALGPLAGVSVLEWHPQPHFVLAVLAGTALLAAISFQQATNRLRPFAR